MFLGPRLCQEGPDHEVGEHRQVEARFHGLREFLEVLQVRCAEIPQVTLEFNHQRLLMREAGEALSLDECGVAGSLGLRSYFSSVYWLRSK